MNIVFKENVSKSREKIYGPGISKYVHFSIIKGLTVLQLAAT